MPDCVSAIDRIGDVNGEKLYRNLAEHQSGAVPPPERQREVVHGERLRRQDRPPGVVAGALHRTVREGCTQRGGSVEADLLADEHIRAHGVDQPGDRFHVGASVVEIGGYELHGVVIVTTLPTRPSR